MTIRIVREAAVIAMLASGGLGDGGQSYDSEKVRASLPIRIFLYNVGILHPAVMIRAGREILGKQLFFYCVYCRCTPETHIQRQAALHDCLPRLLANGDTLIEIVHGEGKIFCTGLASAANAG
jgi:hypothetical protein